VGKTIKSFNATTAFLLLLIENHLYEEVLSFNATTAFLLRHAGLTGLQIWKGFNATTAFLLLQNTSTSPGPGRRFNATTAFLLPSMACSPLRPPSSVSMPPRRSCFPASRNLAATWQLGFQCHHGVPASGLFIFFVRYLFRFQCHHGVPASRSFACDCSS